MWGCEVVTVFECTRLPNEEGASAPRACILLGSPKARYSLRLPALLAPPRADVVVDEWGPRLAAALQRRAPRQVSRALRADADESFTDASGRPVRSQLRPELTMQFFSKTNEA